MYGLAILGVLLALSAAGNAWQYHHGETLVAKAAGVEQLAADTKAAADACQKGVEDLGKSARARQARLETALAGVAPEVRRGQEDALKALSAKPSDPKDLCASLDKYLREQIAAEKGKK